MESETAQRLFPRLRQLRKLRGLTQEGLAELAGIKYKHYQAIESGSKPKVQLPTLAKLADAFGLELWQLFHPTLGEQLVAEHQAKYGRPIEPKKKGRPRKAR